MSNLYVLVGLMGSGKSTWAESYAKDDSNFVVISSDKIRKELYGDESVQIDHAKVFQIMNRRTKENLRDGYNVIYDATNLVRRRRIALIKEMDKYCDKAYAVYMDSDIDECIENDLRRNRQVGAYVIVNAYKKLQIPFKEEGFYGIKKIERIRRDDFFMIKLMNNLVYNTDIEYDDFMRTLVSDIGSEFQDIWDMPHDSRYHTFSVSRHTYHVFKKLQEDGASVELLLASIFHDIGKPFCKSFVNAKGETTRYAHYIGHENVSAQMANKIMTRIGVATPTLTRVLKLIQFHMDFDHATGELKKRTVELFKDDQQFIEDLTKLHEADMLAK